MGLGPQLSKDPLFSHIEKKIIAFVKMARIFDIEIDIFVMYPQKSTLKYLRKSTRKCGRMHI